MILIVSGTRLATTERDQIKQLEAQVRAQTEYVQGLEDQRNLLAQAVIDAEWADDGIPGGYQGCPWCGKFKSRLENHEPGCVTWTARKALEVNGA